MSGVSEPKVTYTVKSVYGILKSETKGVRKKTVPGSRDGFCMPEYAGRNKFCIRKGKNMPDSGMKGRLIL